MSFSNRYHSNKKRRPGRHRRHTATGGPVQSENGGSESAYLKSLVDSHTKVTVVLNNGERLRGVIRYYDRYCFSIGLSAEGPRIFLRKASVSYIAED